MHKAHPKARNPGIEPMAPRPHRAPREKSIYIGKLPISQPGQYLIETPGNDGKIRRAVANNERELHSMASRESVIWCARYSGWVRNDQILRRN